MWTFIYLYLLVAAYTMGKLSTITLTDDDFFEAGYEDDRPSVIGMLVVDLGVTLVWPVVWLPLAYWAWKDRH